MAKQLILPKRYSSGFAVPNRKPVGSVEIDWSCSLSDEIFCYWLAGGLSNLATNKLPSSFTAPAKGPGFDSFAFASSQFIEFPLESRKALEEESQYTLFARFRFGSTLAYRTLIALGSSGTDYGLLWVRTDGTIELQCGTGASNVQIAGTQGQWYTAVAVQKGSSSRALYLSDGQSGFNLNTSTGGALTRVAVGKVPWSSAPYYYDGDIAFAGASSRAWNASEIQSFLLNPYQILKPASPITYFIPSAGGGGNITIDLSSLPATSTGAGVNPDIIKGSITFDASFSAVTGDGVSPLAVMGSLSLDGGQGSSTATAVTPTTINGSITLDLSTLYAESTSGTVSPTSVLGSITLDLSTLYAETTGLGINPSVAVSGGAIDVTPEEATSTGTAEFGTLVLGSLNIAPGTGDATASAEFGDTIYGSITLDLSSAFALGSSAGVSPTLNFGSVIVTPGSSDAESTAIIGIVDDGVIVEAKSRGSSAFMVIKGRKH